MTDGPRLSVILCTMGDRPALLRDAVRSVIEGQSDGGHDVLVVVNGPDDGRRAIVERALNGALDAPIPVRIIHERRPGLSVARNRGVEETDAPVVAFIDDDAVAEKGWVLAHRRAYRDGVAAVGGRIELRWPDRRPRWLPAPFESYYSRLDLGDERAGFEGTGRHPFGTNMSMRREVLVQLGGFPLELGRRGADLLSGEEEEIFARIVTRGERIVYEPGAAVIHRVEPERVSRRWLLRRAYAQGRTEALRRALGPHAGTSWLAESARGLGRATWGSLRLLASGLGRGRTHQLGVRVLLRSAKALGYAVACGREAFR